MNIVECVESQLRATLDKCAFEINICVQDQAQGDRYQQLTSALHEYAKAATSLEVLQKIKAQMPDETPTVDENEG